MEAKSSELVFETSLGQGSYAVVWRGKWNGKEVAIKKFDVAKLSQSDSEEFANETKILTNYVHPSIVQFLGLCNEPNNYCLILEYLPDTLYNLLHSKTELSWYPTLLQIAIDISKGVDFLHSSNVLHRDLKSTNILLTSEKRAKICDFGKSIIRTSATLTSKPIDQKGSLRWTAPEILAGGSRSNFSDIFSLGMVFWEMSSREYPYHEEDNIEVIKDWIKIGKKPKLEDNFPLASLIEECWSKPEKRPQASHIIVTLESMQKFVQYVQRSNSGESEYNKGNQLRNSGKWKESSAFFLRAAELHFPPSFLRMHSLSIADKQRNFWKQRAASYIDFFKTKLDNNSATSDDYYNLGYCYFIEIEDGREKAIPYLEKASLSEYPPALSTLGICYEYGIGVPIDLAKAIEFYEKAASVKYAAALTNLGQCYENGKGVEKDLKKAANYYQEAASQKYVRSQINLALCYLKEKGVEKNIEKALQLLKEAGEEGEDNAHFELGKIYLKGKYVAQDIPKAIECFEKAAIQENGDAQSYLGRYYESTDFRKAIYYYSLAAHNGDEFALRKLENLNK